MIPTATKGTLMIKYKLDQQHRPFWGWVERNLLAFIVVDLIGVIIFAVLWGYLHIDWLAAWWNHH